MHHDAELIECASLPASLIASLSGLRREPGVTVSVAGDRAWVRWDPASSSVLDKVRPVAGAELYSRRDGLWYRLGHRLPSFGLPPDDGDRMPIHRAILPLPVWPEAPRTGPIEPVRLALVRDDTARPATAMESSLEELGRWAEMAPSSRLGALRAARSGDSILVLGNPLPPLAGGFRFWGSRVLIPLGMRPDPDLPESALRVAMGAGEGLLVLKDVGTEVVPLGAFRPLSRAGIRLSRGGQTR